MSYKNAKSKEPKKEFAYSSKGLLPKREATGHSYNLSFDAREKGAIGVRSAVELEVYGPPNLREEELRLGLYSHYDSIMWFKVNKNSK